MSHALFAGTFDPPTVGHADIIRRAAEAFDCLDVVLFVNAEKSPLFSEEERLAFLKKVCRGIDPRITVSLDGGMVAEYAKRQGIDTLVRGIRNDADRSYEETMAQNNLRYGGPQTRFFEADPRYAAVSSTAVKAALAKGEKIDGAVPAAICADVLKSYRQKTQK